MESARADVLIETIQCSDSGDLPYWPWHAQRLSRSAQALGFKPVPADLEQRVKTAIAATRSVGAPPPGAPDLTPGTPASHDVASTSQNLAPTLNGPTPIEPCPRRVRLLYQREGDVSITIAPLAPLRVPAMTAFAHTILGNHAALDSSEPLLQHKATHRPWYVEATQWLDAHPDYFDLIFFNERGELCEGSRTNVYVQVAGEWLTPAVENGCLPGTVRARLLAEKRVRVDTIDAALLANAQAWRLSNGLRGWFDVSLVKGALAG